MQVGSIAGGVLVRHEEGVRTHGTLSYYTPEWIRAKLSISSALARL